MNKILSGILGVLVVAGVVGGAAFAVLSDTASLTNLALSTGSAALEIKLTGDPTEAYDEERNVAIEGFFADALIPGSYDEVAFDLRNSSDEEVDFLLTGQLVPGTGDWDTLKGVVTCVVYSAGEDPEGAASVSSGWWTLEEWSTLGRDLPGDPLAPTSETSLVLRCMLPETADNTTAGLDLAGLEFVVTGTQEVVEP